MSFDKKALEKEVREYNQGKMSRRSFLTSVTALGLTAATAGSLATVYGGNVFAKSTKEVSEPGKGYDYIIVGSGSAGSALAYRLATTTDASILVLEAGGSDEVPEIHDPRLWGAALSTRAAKWFSTVEQPNTDSRTHSWPRGNAMGGTSGINAMIYARGHRSDFDNWAYDGCVGWDYKSVLKHYKELENFEGGENEYRSTGGPLNVTRPQPNLRHPGGQMFIDSCKALGHKENDDFNSERMEGPAWVNFTIKDQRRQSTAVAFLKPAMEQANLSVLTDAPVTKLIIENNRCVGVEYSHDGQPQIVRANNEVILSAGAIDTPRILMVSGIGPASHLSDVGVNSIIDLPGVGENLQDHVLGAGPNYESPTPVPESNYNHSEVYMWARSDSRLRAPDISALYISLPFSTPALPMDGINNGWSVLSGLMRPTSRGSIRLKSGNIKIPPIIDPNYLATDHDKITFSKATELAREIALQNAYKEVRKKEWLPGPNIKPGSAEWDEFVARSVNTFYHPTSTCRMGVDHMSVVDPELMVYGVSGLRIADASIMPCITTGNTNAPSIMIGWKCAEMIRAAV